MIAEGFQIMLIGMGVVVAFLILLVFVMMIIGRIVRAIDILNPIQETGGTVSSPSASRMNNSAIATVIAIAKSKK